MKTNYSIYEICRIVKGEIKEVKGAINIKIKKIFTKKVACELIKRENELIRIEDNLKYKNLKVFVFEETPKLLSDLTQITNIK